MGRKYNKIQTVRLTEYEREMFQKVLKQNNEKAQIVLRQFILEYIKENVVK